MSQSSKWLFTRLQFVQTFETDNFGAPICHRDMNSPLHWIAYMQSLRVDWPRSIAALSAVAYIFAMQLSIVPGACWQEAEGESVCFWLFIFQNEAHPVQIMKTDPHAIIRWHHLHVDVLHSVMHRQGGRGALTCR
jgi:hypothetical protein